MDHCTFKGDKGKRRDVQSQIYKVLPKECFFVWIVSRNLIFEFLNIIIYCKKSDFLVLLGDLDQ